MIRTERITFALNHVSATGGWDFEVFCNAFLSSEIEGLRPVGGVHDRGRDAVIYSSQENETTFLQYSITEKWEDKIKKTIATLKNNDFDVKELIYCTSKSIIARATDVRKYARSNGVSLDIRDRSYFVANANSSSSTLSACEEFAGKYCDPITTRAVAEESLGPPQADPEVKAALTALSAELVTRNDGKSLEKIGMEALLEYSLRAANPDNPKSRSKIHDDFIKMIRSHPTDTIKARVDGMLSRLSSRNGRIKHHKSKDGFTLEFSERERLSDRYLEISELRRNATEDMGEMLDAHISENEIDYAVEKKHFLEDIFTLALAYLYKSADDSVSAISSRDYSGANSLSLFEFVEAQFSDNSVSLLTDESHSRLEQIDILPPLLDKCFSTPTTAIQQYLNKASRTYEFLFSIQELDKIRDSVARLVSACKILLDTNILVQCLCDYIRPSEERSVIKMLHQCRDLDTELFATSETITELYAQIRTARGIFKAKLRGQQIYGNSELVDAYLYHNRGQFTGFEQFSEAFCGFDDPRLDLKEFLKAELGVEFDEFDDERNQIDHERLEALTSVLYARRPQKFTKELLIELSRNDAKILLLTEQLRSRPGSSRQWWLLTRDKRLHRLDHEIRESEAMSLTMNPNYFTKYLGLYSRNEGDALPLAFDMAAKGFIPDELIEGLESLEREIQNLPQYRQKRKLREFERKMREEKER
ncbi:MAG: hypothetical protein WD342_19250 [Verrucomicrobiales bacterium]